MTQSNLYKFGGGGGSSTVDVSSDDTRDLGNVDIKQFPILDADITDDGTRTLGEAQVTNTVATELTETGQTTAEDSGTGSLNAAELDLGDVRQNIDIWVDTNGAADLTIEVSPDNTNWRPFKTISYGSASTDLIQETVAHQYVRAYLSASRNLVEIVGRSA